MLHQVRDHIRALHDSLRIEDAYLLWIKRFIRFQGKRHPPEMGEDDVAAFLADLAVVGDVAASTQNQALNALLFLHKVVPDRSLERIDEVVRAKRPARLPEVLTREEVRAMLAGLRGEKWLMVSLLYGSGLRLLECLRLHVKDVDFGQVHLVVRDGKGQKDRVTVLPSTLVGPQRPGGRGQAGASRRSPLELGRRRGARTTGGPALRAPILTARSSL